MKSFDLAQDRLREIQGVLARHPGLHPGYKGVSIQQSYYGEPLALFFPSLAARPIVR